MSEEKEPVLYKCPYCAKGRFTASDGWKVACEHVRSHQSGSLRKKKKTLTPEESDGVK